MPPTLRATSCLALLSLTILSQAQTLSQVGINTFKVSEPSLPLTTPTFLDFDAGLAMSAGVRTDGTLYAWGTSFKNSLVVPSGTFTAVSTGRDLGFAIRTDGTIAAWSYNGDAMFTPPTGQFVKVSAGALHGLAMRQDGSVESWGWDEYGETVVPPGTYKDIIGGYGYSLAIKSDDTLAGWGWNDYDQCDVPSGTYIAAAAGFYHGVAIKTDGTLVGWGRNDYGQAAPPAGTYTKVAAGLNHSAAIKTDGTVVIWGRDYLVNPPAGTFVDISANERGTFARRADGTVVGPNPTDGPPWGSFREVTSRSSMAIGLRDDGSLIILAGYPQFRAGPYLTAVNCERSGPYGLRADGTIEKLTAASWDDPPLPAGPIVDLFAGGDLHFALKADGTIVHFSHFYGLWPQPGVYKSVAAGTYHALFLRYDGTFKFFGSDYYGVGTLPSGTFKAAASGEDFSIAIRTDGTLVGWGRNDVGQTIVPPGQFVAVAAGTDHALALKSDGTVVAWGNNDKGQTSIPAGAYSSIAAGAKSSFTITASGATARADRYRTNANTNVFVPTPGVIDNDVLTDSALIVSGPSHASVFSLNPDGSFSYTPDAGFVGLDSFTYRAWNGVTPGSETTVEILVTPAVQAFSVSNSPLEGGTPLSATINLNTNAPAGGTKVYLSDNTSAINSESISPVTVPEGQSSLTFSIQTSQVGDDSTRQITADPMNGSVKKTINVTLLTPAAVLKTLTLAQTSVVGGQGTSGTVAVFGRVPGGGAVINLSSNSSAISVPSTATISTNSGSANFNVTTSPVNANATRLVYASYSGVTKQVALTLLPNIVIASLNLNPAAVVSGDSSVGTVTLSHPARAGGASVAISSNSGVVIVPSSAMVPVNEISKTFPIQTTAILTTATRTIYASFNAVTKTRSIVLHPRPKLVSVTINPTTVKGGDPAHATVTLDRSTGLDIQLYTSGGSVSIVTPSPVTVPAGSTVVTFPITTKPVGATYTRTIMVDYGYNQRKTANLTITP